MKEKFYTCKYDRAFKEIMLNEENKDILKWFLESILKVKIKEIEVKTVERNSGNLKIKRKILDALLKTNIGKLQIEVNSNNENYVHPRNMAYITDIYSHDTLVGEEYTEETKYIQINLTYGIKEEKAYRIYKMQDNEEKKYIENLEIYEFNMDFYKKIWDNKDEKEIKENKALIMLDLPLEELKKLSKEDRMVNKYMSKLEKINKEPEFREYMSLEEDFRKIRNSLLSEAKEKARKEGLEEGLKEGMEQGLEKGFEEGIEKGIEKGIQQIVKNMIDMNVDIEDISKTTGLSIEEIENLK